MITEIDLDKLPDACKSHLLAAAEEGVKPSEAIIRIIERESFRRGFRIDLGSGIKRRRYPKPATTTAIKKTPQEKR